MRKLGLAFVFAVLCAAMPFAQAPVTVNIIGEWDLTTSSPVGENTNTVEFRKDGETLQAFAKSPQGPGERPYDAVKLEGDKLTLVLTVDFQGQAMIITYSGTVADTSINGSADFGGLAEGTFTATRKEPAK